MCRGVRSCVCGGVGGVKVATAAENQATEGFLGRPRPLSRMKMALKVGSGRPENRGWCIVKFSMRQAFRMTVIFLF